MPQATECLDAEWGLWEAFIPFLDVPFGRISTRKTCTVLSSLLSKRCSFLLLLFTGAHVGKSANNSSPSTDKVCLILSFSTKTPIWPCMVWTTFPISTSLQLKCCIWLPHTVLLPVYLLTGLDYSITPAIFIIPLNLHLKSPVVISWNPQSLA